MAEGKYKKSGCAADLHLFMMYLAITAIPAKAQKKGAVNGKKTKK
jgi:hypothetical protein